MSGQEETGSPHYEHAGTWSCDSCGEEFEVESKVDPLSHVFECGSGPDVSPKCRHDGYRRRQRELREART